MARASDRKRLAVLAAAVAVLPAARVLATSASWTGPTSGAWEVSDNWAGSPAQVPGFATGETATFNAASANLTVVPDAGRGIQNITFDTGAAAYIIGTTGGNALTLENGGMIQTTAGVTAIQTVNAPLQIAGAGYTFSSNAPVNTNLLNFGGTIQTTGGATTLTLTGSNLLQFPNSGAAGTNQINGIISNPVGGSSIAINKTGAGSWTLNAANSYSGGTTVSAGVLSVRNNTGLGTGSVDVAAGASLQLAPNGINVANNVTLNGITEFTAGFGGALIGGVDGGNNTATLSGTLTLNATSNVASYWSDKTFVISGKVTGVGGLRIDKVATGNGAPNVSLTNSTNDYSGGTTISAGAAGGVLIFANNALGSGNLTFAGSSTARWGTGNTQDISGKIQTIPTGVTATLDTNGNNVTFGSAIGAAGTGTINKAGAGVLSLGGTEGSPVSNNITAAVTITGGTLAVPKIDDGASGIGTGGITFAGGTLRYTGSTSPTSTRAWNGASAAGGGIEVTNAAANLSINSGFTGNAASAITKSGPGTLTLGGAADNGSLVINAQAGTVNLAKTAAGGTRAVAGISNIAPGATVRLTGLDSDQIYGGNTTAHGLVNIGGGTLDLNARSEGVARLSGTGTVTNSGGALSTFTVGETNGSSSFAGTIQNGTAPVALTKVGTGTQTLTGVNTYTGATTISGGTLRLNPGVPVSGAALWLDANDSATVSLNAGTVTAWADKSGNGRNATQGTAANQPGYTTNALVGNKNVVRFTATDVMPVNLSFLNGSPYTIFAIEAKASAAPSSSFYFLGTQTAATNQGLHFGYRNDTSFALAQYGNDLDYANASLAFTTQTFRQWTGRLDTAAGGGHAIFLNGTSVATNTNLVPMTNPGQGVVGQGFQASTQYLGDIGEIIIFPTALSPTDRATVEAYLQSKWFGSGIITQNVLPATTAVSIASGAALDVGVTNQTIGSLSGPSGASVVLGGGTLTVGDATPTTTFGGVISGAGGLTKQGAGTLVLSGANTFTGTTTVNAGTLGGTGGVAGPLTIASGGSVAPGNSVGTLSSGDLDLQSGGTYSLELDPTNSGGLGTTDVLNVTGGVTLAGNLAISLLSTPTNGQQFTIILNDGTGDAVTGTFANAGTLTAGGWNFAVNLAGGDGNEVVLTASPVPEPAALGLLGIAAAGLLTRRRRS